MEPFSITCTTCKSRLKVKSQAAVGQLVKCPKCGGMVMVKSPEEKKPGDSASLNAETAPAIQKPGRPGDAQDTIGENQDFEDVEALLLGHVPKSPPPAVKTAIRDKPARFAEGAPAAAGNGAANGKVASHSAAAAEPQSEPAPPIPGSEVVPLPAANWSSERPWKYWLFLAASVLVGIGLAFGVVVFSLSFFHDQESGIAQNPAASPEATSPAENPVTTVPEKGTQPATPPASAQVGKKSSPPTVPAEKLSSKSTPPVATAPKPDEDPLGIATKAPTQTKPPTSLANDPLAKFNPLLGNPADDPTAPAPPPSAAPPAKPAEAVVEAPAKASLPRPAPRNVNLAVRLNDSLSGLSIKAEEVHLADFLQAMQDFSTIPITLEPDNLAVFKQSAETYIPSLELENQKFGAALGTVLSTLNLEMAVEEEQIVVRRPEMVRNKETRELELRQVSYPVKDLTHDDEKQAAELAQRITALVEPGTWADEEEDKTAEGEKKTEGEKNACSLTPGKATFAVRHRLSAHAQILVLLQKLRVARGLPIPKDIDPELIRLSTRTERASPRLSTQVSLTFNRPTPLVKIAQKLSAAGKLRILIDWRSLATVGWNPDAELTLVVDKKPLSEALRALLEPMDLAYRVVDGRTIQIVAPQLLAERLEIELYPAKDLVASQEQVEPLLARIRSSLVDGGEGELAGQLWIDPESKCLVALLSQPKQQQLTKFLAEWRTKEMN